MGAEIRVLRALEDYAHQRDAAARGVTGRGPTTAIRQATL
jgi:hypothetical protein